MQRSGLWHALALVCAATEPLWAQDSVLRLDQAEYLTGEGLLTVHVVYDLTAGVVGDNYFDLTASVDPVPGTGSISIVGAVRSSPYLYDSALAGAGVFNLSTAEFQIAGNVLQSNQGSNDPVADMDLTAGQYLYADITLSVTGPEDSKFNLTFSNIGLDDENVMSRPLAAVASIVRIPEPSFAAMCVLCALWGHRRSSRHCGM